MANADDTIGKIDTDGVGVPACEVVEIAGFYGPLNSITVDAFSEEKKKDAAAAQQAIDKLKDFVDRSGWSGPLHKLSSAIREHIRPGARFRLCFHNYVWTDPKGNPQIFEVEHVSEHSFRYSPVIFDDVPYYQTMPPGSYMRFESAGRWIDSFVPDSTGGRLMLFKEWVEKANESVDIAK